MKRVGRRTAAGLTVLVLLCGGSASAVAAETPDGRTPVLSHRESDHGNTTSRPTTSGRLVAFYQTGTTTGDGTPYLSPAPLAGHADVVEVSAFHLNDPAQYPILTLNSDSPDAQKYDPMWRDIDAVKARGVKVTALLGGAAPGTYTFLDEDFEKYYPPIRDALRSHHLDGIDLDVEEHFTEATAEKLIKRLRTDFPSPEFLITLAPVPRNLTDPLGRNLPGLDYRTLEANVGSAIDWYNAQFYCGNGSLADTSGYDRIVQNRFPASKVVAAAITVDTPYCGGYVPMATLQNTLRSLAAKYPGFAGSAGWEYALSTDVDAPDCPTGPAGWYCAVRQALPTASGPTP
ncbi:glycosyl hydrolase family 18 protein [Streptomyces erythrochromogenes]|uniref:glycosyl hydrolase family 18 protein n=1 Tax=Streptomyces erythrochromogenes TaxID=285574 RepID=UPI00343129E5